MILKALVIYHRSDLDGIASGEICRHFISKSFSEDDTWEVTMLGWTYGDPVPEIATDEWESIYMVDLCIDLLMANKKFHDKVVWIDHHKSSIERWDSPEIDSPVHGYRLDGVAACRLCWQWCTTDIYPIPFEKKDYVDLLVKEPKLIRMLGEYDVWDMRDPRVVDLQFGLKAKPDYFTWDRFFKGSEHEQEFLVDTLLDDGKVNRKAIEDYQAGMVKDLAHTLVWQKLTWCVMNMKGSSGAGKSAVAPEHDAILMWWFNGEHVVVSLFGVPGKPDPDLCAIAKQYGGGGHKQACGFTCTLEGIQEILEG